MAGTTTKLQLPYPESTDNNNVPADLLAIANRLDAVPGVESLTTAARDALAAPQKWTGRVIYNTTTARLEWWNGTLWDRVTTSDDVVSFGREGTLVVTAGKGRHYWPFAVEVLGVRAAVNTAPAGASVIVDVNKDGTTIFTTQANRPTIAAAANVSTEAVPDTPARLFAAGTYMTVDIDQVGSTTAGSDLTVVIRYQKTA